MSAAENLLFCGHPVGCLVTHTPEVDGGTGWVMCAWCADKANLEAERDAAMQNWKFALDQRDVLREKLQDLLNNEFCTCQSQNTPCPRCLVSISEAKSALKEQPFESGGKENGNPIAMAKQKRRSKA